MKVLLDENLSPRFRSVLGTHEVITVRFAGWAGLTNGELLRTAESAGFEVFLTGDKSLSYQQNLHHRKIAVVVLSAHSWDLIQAHLPAITAAVDGAVPGSFRYVECVSSNSRAKDGGSAWESNPPLPLSDDHRF